MTIKTGWRFYCKKVEIVHTWLTLELIRITASVVSYYMTIREKLVLLWNGAFFKNWHHEGWKPKVLLSSSSLHSSERCFPFPRIWEIFWSLYLWSWWHDPLISSHPKAISHQCMKTMNWHLVQFSRSVVSDSLRPHGCSTPGLPVHHQLLEPTQTHVHWVSDAIQPSHPLSSPSPPALNLSQHQGFFKWVSSSHEVAKVLEFPASTSVLPINIQDWFPLGWTGYISLQSNGLSRVFSNTTVQKHQFFGAQLSL